MVLCRKSGGCLFFAERKETDMVQVLKGNIVQAPGAGGAADHGARLSGAGGRRDPGRHDRLPLEYATAPLVDYGQALVMQSFADMHLHAPQYPMLGMGMDLPLLEWLDTYTFPTEARFADTDYACRIYRRLATGPHHQRHHPCVYVPPSTPTPRGSSWRSWSGPASPAGQGEHGPATACPASCRRPRRNLSGRRCGGWRDVISTTSSPF